MDAVANPWEQVVHLPDQSIHPLSFSTSIVQIYDNAGGELLILGEPGSGKTTLLLELTRELLSRATKDETHPIPVVFNLSSWAVKRQPLADWLVGELDSKYQVPRKLGQAWIDTNLILVLLDGLDEVGQEHRTACIGAINTYRHDHGIVPTVVCSRTAEYRKQLPHVQLQLRNAVVLEPLTTEQINIYLSSGGEQLEAVRVVLQNDPVLREFATSPLMLNVLKLI